MIRDFNGKTPKIAGSAFISKVAHVIGDVEIGENSSVWPGVVVRGDFAKIKIGKNSAVEDNCVIHAGLRDLIIGDNVIIGHGSVIHCRRIGDYSLIGMNSTILEDAEIDDFCIIAAGSLIEQGVKVPAKSFVAGVPGKIKRKVSAEQSRTIMVGADIYSQLAKQYKEQNF